jgi:hypothetical protein
MFSGQNTAKPSFLNYLFANNEFHCSFAVSGRTARSRSRSRRRRNKDMPRQQTDLAPRRAHARNANTNTKHDFPVGGVTKDSPPQPPIIPFLGPLPWGSFFSFTAIYTYIYITYMARRQNPVFNLAAKSS